MREIIVFPKPADVAFSAGSSAALPPLSAAVTAAAGGSGVSAWLYVCGVNELPAT